jgi:hypothetical protein
MRKESKIAGIVSAVVIAFLAAAATESGRRIAQQVFLFLSGKPASCPTIAGDWNHQTLGGIPLILRQTECRVSGTYETPRRKYTIKAEYSNGAFHGTLLKLPKAAGDCSSELPLLISVVDEQTRLKMVTTGMDCDGSPADPPVIWVHG